MGFFIGLIWFFIGLVFWRFLGLFFCVCVSTHKCIVKVLLKWVISKGSEATFLAGRI